MNYRFVILAFLLISATVALADEKPPAFDPAAMSVRVLLERANCTACHRASETQVKWLAPKVAPRLADIGRRAGAKWIMQFLAAPHQIMPGATMPDVLHGLPAKERADAAEAMTHYLLSKGTAAFKPVFPDKAAVARGESLYHRVGCVACHAPQRGGAKAIVATPLPNMAAKWSLDGLRRFLLDPLATRPSGRMPAMRLTDGEAGDLAHYLLRDTRVAAAAELATYHVRVRSLEEIDTAEPARTEPVEAIAVNPALWEHNWALRFTSWLRVDRAGDYTFYLDAAGAGRFAIDGKWFAGEDSWENEKVNAKVALHLDAGLHALKVDYVHRGNKPAALKLEWEGPNLQRSAISAAHLQSDREVAPAPFTFAVDPAKADLGRSLYEKYNCGVCHDTQPAGKAAPALLTLKDAQAGCLAVAPSADVPDFHFNSAQRDSLRAALGDLNRADLPPPSDRQRVANTMAAFNCIACHARDGVGGVSAERDAYFTSNAADAGDEGRIPPKLDGVGDKLLVSWLEAVLTQGGSVRPYFDTRMPQFGKENVGHLPALFVAIDRKPQQLAAVSDAPQSQRVAGRKMVGTDGFSCIVCHRFNGQPGQTLQLIDLITGPARLNEDWFRRFLRDPAKFHPGTRMPSFWPDGKSALPAVLGGDINRQHAAIWAYLSDGPRAKFPQGIGRQNVELVAGGEAIVYRGKLWEAGFRAVAIAYPGQVNAAFDAEDMRLSLLWQGRFLNAGPHWTVQGMGKIRPLAREIAIFPHGPELAVLADAKTPWPQGNGHANGLKFRGYQLDALKRPTLLYSIGSVDVEDFMMPMGEAGKLSLKRTIRLTGPEPAALYFRAGGGKVIAVAPNTWKMNDLLTIRIHGATAAILRGSGETRELLIPVAFEKNQAEIEVEYGW